MIDRAALRGVAERANARAPGEWEADEIDPNDPEWAAFDLFSAGDKIGHTVGEAPSRVFGREIAAHVVAFNPATALRLLSELDTLRAERDELVAALREIAGGYHDSNCDSLLPGDTNLACDCYIASSRAALSKHASKE